MKQLSIVIPTFNMEQYLHRSLCSLLIDKKDVLDVIIVNDGSTDSSLDIAHEYEKKYPETFRVIDKENGNYGSCVNRGIDEAVGKYFRILDADDYFDRNALTELIKKIENFTTNSEPDLIITNYQEDFLDGYTKFFLNDKYKYDKLYDAKDILLGKQRNDYWAVMHRMTYKMEVIRKSGLRHTEGISYTDSEYCFYPLREVKTILFMNVFLYRYQIGREGQTVSIVSYQKNIHSIYKIVNRMLLSFSFDEKNATYYNKLVTVMENCLSLYYKIILTTKFEHNEDLQSLDERILYFDKDVYNNLATIKKIRIIPFVALWRKGIKTNNYIYTKLFYLIEKLHILLRKQTFGH